MIEHAAELSDDLLVLLDDIKRGPANRDVRRIRRELEHTLNSTMIVGSLLDDHTRNEIRRAINDKINDMIGKQLIRDGMVAAAASSPDKNRIDVFVKLISSVDTIQINVTLA